MVIKDVPSKPARLLFEPPAPALAQLGGIVLTRRGFRVPIDDEAHPHNALLCQLFKQHLTKEYPDNPHASRYAKKPAPLQCYRVDTVGAKRYMTLPKFWALRQFSARDPPVSFVNENAPGEAMAEHVQFSANRELCESRRRPQQSATSYALAKLRATGGAVLVMPVGTGKTVCAIYVAMQLRQRTLVCAGNEDLLDQWEERLHEYAPNCTIGRIQGTTCHVTACDFVLATVQSLSQKDYDAAAIASIGMVIFDEAHHAAAPSFIHAVWQVAAPYMLALTQDPTRLDDMTDILYHFFSWNVYIVPPTLPPAITLNVHVHRFTQRCYVEDADLVRLAERMQRRQTHPDRADADALAERPRSALQDDDTYSERGYVAVYPGVARQANRNAVIVAYIKQALASTHIGAIHMPTEEEIDSTELPPDVADPDRGQVQVQIGGDETFDGGVRVKCIGACTRDDLRHMRQIERQILCLSTHKVHLVSLRRRLVRSGVPEHMIGVYWGGMKRAARQEALHKRIVLATDRMAREGLDLATLNTIFFDTPCANVDQPVGRGLRDKMTADVPPLIFDFDDSWCQMASAMYWKRERCYRIYHDEAGKAQYRIRYHVDARTDTIVGAYCQHCTRAGVSDGVSDAYDSVVVAAAGPAARTKRTAKSTVSPAEKRRRTKS